MFDPDGSKVSSVLVIFILNISLNHPSVQFVWSICCIGWLFTVECYMLCVCLGLIWSRTIWFCLLLNLMFSSFSSFIWKRMFIELYSLWLYVFIFTFCWVKEYFSKSCFICLTLMVPSSKTTIEEFPLLGNKLPSVFHNPEQLCPVVLLYPSHQQSNTTQSPRVIERQRDIWVTSV